MANNDFSDLKVQTDDQLATRLSELKREQFNLRFQAATGQMEKPGRVRQVRRSIARIKTLQSGRKAQQPPKTLGA
jgi:large subunit ribosomal protein L29